MIRPASSSSSSSSAAGTVRSVSSRMRTRALGSSRSAIPASRRFMSASPITHKEDASHPAYPFSSSVAFHQPPSTVKHANRTTKRFQNFPPLPEVKKPSRGVIDYVHHHLRSQLDPGAKFTSMFHRNSDNRIPTGSVLSVRTYTSPEKTSTATFAGVLIAVRRRGTSTSFVLRNLVANLGVEVKFNIYSPLLKDIKVIAKADCPKRVPVPPGSVRRVTSAKLYRIRDNEEQLARISRLIKSHNQTEARNAAVKAEEARKLDEERKRSDRKAAKEARQQAETNARQKAQQQKLDQKAKEAAEQQAQVAKERAELKAKRQAEVQAKGKEDAELKARIQAEILAQMKAQGKADADVKLQDQVEDKFAKTKAEVKAKEQVEGTATEAVEEKVAQAGAKAKRETEADTTGETDQKPKGESA